MDFVCLSVVWTLGALATTLAIAAALAGCSSSSRELRTPGQTAGFIAEVASGEPYSDWTLPSDASQRAVQAWAARVQLGDLGNKLRNASHVQPSVGSEEEPTWTCAMARQLVALGTVGGITSYNNNDIEIVTKEALKEGIHQDDISAMIHDTSTVPFRDLALATALVCGPSS